MSNIIPDPGFAADQLAVRCALCSAAMTRDHRGGLCTGPTDCGVVCDRCGDAQAPQLMVFVWKLRLAVAFTVTVEGADPKVDALALTCPVCDKPSDERQAKWHVVDTKHGRPVCRGCVQHAFTPGLATLADALILLDRQNEEISIARENADPPEHAAETLAPIAAQADEPFAERASARAHSTACRRCHAHDLHRSRIRPWEHVLKLLTSRRPYRCGSCGWRVWRLPG